MNMLLGERGWAADLSFFERAWCVVCTAVFLGEYVCGRGLSSAAAVAVEETARLRVHRARTFFGSVVDLQRSVIVVQGENGEVLHF